MVHNSFQQTSQQILKPEYKTESLARSVQRRFQTMSHRQHDSPKVNLHRLKTRTCVLKNMLRTAEVKKKQTQTAKTTGVGRIKEKSYDGGRGRTFHRATAKGEKKKKV